MAATTAPITVVDPPTQLVVTIQPPASVAANAGFGVTVEAVDADGNLASGFDGSVTVALAGKPAGGKLHGALTVTASNGVATFSGLRLNKVGRGCVLRVTANGLAPASTTVVTVSAVATHRLSVAARPARSKAKVATVHGRTDTQF